MFCPDTTGWAGPRIYSTQSLSGSNEQIVCAARKHEQASVGRWVEEGNLGLSLPGFLLLEVTVALSNGQFPWKQATL